MSFTKESQDFFDKEYGLGRGYVSAMRLNIQHHLIRQLIGYTTHPEIVSRGSLPLNPRIADIGTGTGQWLIDVSNELPFAILDGFDISDEQFPHRDLLPGQISFTQLDILRPIPPNLEAKYDIVHVQFFIFVVSKDTIAAVLKELLKMLKPGGFLQWVDYDPTTFKVASPSPSLKQEAFDKYTKLIRAPQGTTITWPSELSSHMESVGFEQIVSKDYPIPPHLRAPFMHCHLSAAEEASFVAMKNDGPEAEGPRFRKLLAEVYREHQAGVTMAESPIVTIGRKPLM